VNRRKAKPVLRIQSALRKFIPRLDVAKVVEQFFALHAEHGKIRVKLNPHFSIMPGRARQTAYAASLQHRVKRGEVAKLHRKTVWGASYFLRDFDNDWISLVQLSERQLAVKIQGDEET
jgi:hypothetical protein